MDIDTREILSGYTIMAGYDAGLTTDQIKRLLNALDDVTSRADENHAQDAYNSFATMYPRDKHGMFIM